VGAVITAAGVLFLWWGTHIRDRDFEANMADTRLRAATLEKEAADAKLETEKLKGQLAWRTIDANKSNELVAQLSKNPSSVFIEYVWGDSETMYLLLQIERIFTAAGWKVAVRGNQYGGVVFGIIIPDDPNNSQSVANVRTAFSSIGMSFGTGPIEPQITFSMGASPGPESVKIVIGSKKPQFVK
jgi:predicted signal transduction protein with EAL and GGDEF domain